MFNYRQAVDQYHFFMSALRNKLMVHCLAHYRNRFEDKSPDNKKCHSPSNNKKCHSPSNNKNVWQVFLDELKINLFLKFDHLRNKIMVHCLAH